MVVIDCQTEKWQGTTKPSLIAEAAPNGNALLQTATHDTDVSLQPGQMPGGEEATRSGHRLLTGTRMDEQTFCPISSFDQEPSQKPHPEGTDDPEPDLRIAFLERKAQSGPDIVLLLAQPASHKLRSRAKRCGSASTARARTSAACRCCNWWRSPAPGAAPGRIPSGSLAWQSEIPRRCHHVAGRDSGRRVRRHRRGHRGQGRRWHRTLAPRRQVCSRDKNT